MVLRLGASAVPIGLNLSSIGVTAAWWLASARRAEESGFASIWIWDHFVSRGRLDDPVLECWTMLAAAAVNTERVRLGPFVSNVMNRHPAVLARMAATVAQLSGGRLVLGLGAGGHPAEHEAYGIEFPPRPVRAEHLQESVQVLRRLFAGGPVDFDGRHYRLRGALAFPAPDPRPPIMLAAQTPFGARQAARLADSWTCFARRHAALWPVFRTETEALGRDPATVPLVVGLEAADYADGLERAAERWAAAGAAEVIVHDAGPEELERLLAEG
jgi:alkanesulfonate monooxygenase SsuD/methylene tetrahydromethanopterin reductase-like flavin-dependent oxidoreductase (luciferase family)